MFPAVEAMLGSLHPVKGGVLQRGPNFQTCMNILNNFFFLQFWEFLAPPSYFANMNTKQAEMWDSRTLSAATTVNS
jgi:hypothetical protein